MPGHGPAPGDVQMPLMRAAPGDESRVPFLARWAACPDMLSGIHSSVPNRGS